jgi:outer membrane protein
MGIATAVLLRASTPILALFCAYLAPGTLFAQETKPPVIVVIDTQRIYRESIALKELQLQMDGQRSTYQQELRFKEQELRAAQQDLIRERGSLSPRVFADKGRELEERVVAVQREVQARKRELDKRFSQGMNQLRSLLVEIAQEIAQERKADLVIEKGAVVLVKPELEITQKALDALNDRLPQIQSEPAQN